MKKILTALFAFVIINAVVVGRVAAQNVSYKIRDAATLPAPTVSGVGRVVDWGITSFQYNGERIIMSRDANGEGNSRLGDQFQLIVSQPGGGTKLFDYTNHNSSCTVYNLPVSPKDVTNSFGAPGYYNITWRYLDWCGGTKPVDSLHLMLEPRVPSVTPSPTVVPTATPTILPTATVTPVLTGPTPFLRLPWDYEKHGLSFGEAALRMSSYFDHEFPLLSTSLVEPDETKNTVITFKNDKRTTESYTSHDGYDYAFGARARLGDAVLAAAGGRATFMNNCPACGNAILIDHGNNYQTRYYHLSKTDLIVADTVQTVTVVEGQKIGLVGATGNVTPAGDRGAHIHFMVVEDKNRDGNFEDNIPDGVTDPYGWSSAAQDPWEHHTFTYKNAVRSGNKSNYLWKANLDGTTRIIQPTGGAATIPHASFNFDPESYSDAFTFTVLRSTPVTYGESLASVGNAIIAQAVAGVDIFITQFNKLFTLEIDFSHEDISLFRPETLSIYSSSDGATWSREETVVDLTAGKATAQMDHLSRFALMGEKIDNHVPVAIATFAGKQGEKGWFRSDVVVSLSLNDGTPAQSAGTDYILYKLDDGDWDTYMSPFTVMAEGRHTVEFYGADRAGNVSVSESIPFVIDTKTPEARVFFDKNTLAMTMASNDADTSISQRLLSAKEKTEEVMLRDKAGNMLSMVIKDREKGTAAQVTFLSLRYNEDDMIVVEPSKLATLYRLQLADPLLRVFEQTYSTKNNTLLNLLYTAKTDQTKVNTGEKGKTKLTEVLSGMRILQVSTDRGTLKYEY